MTGSGPERKHRRLDTPAVELYAGRLLAVLAHADECGHVHRAERVLADFGDRPPDAVAESRDLGGAHVAGRLGDRRSEAAQGSGVAGRAVDQRRDVAVAVGVLGHLPRP